MLLTTCIKPDFDNLQQACSSPLASSLLKQFASSLLKQFASSLSGTTCIKSVRNNLHQAMRTHPHIGVTLQYPASQIPLPTSVYTHAMARCLLPTWLCSYWLRGYWLSSYWLRSYWLSSYWLCGYATIGYWLRRYLATSLPGCMQYL